MSSSSNSVSFFLNGTSVTLTDPAPDLLFASRLERKLDGLFQFDAPATVQEVRRACEVSTADLA